MTEQTKLVALIAGASMLALLGLGALAAIVHSDIQRQAEEQKVLEKNTAPAEAFQPNCNSESPEFCEIWSEFREKHPFPYQTIAAGRLADNSLLFVVSEPPPHVKPENLSKKIESIFGTQEIHRFKWFIGEDGWLEDLVFRHQSDSKSGDPMDDPDLRDRVAELHELLFGTAFLGDLESIETSSPPILAEARNLSVTPAELAAWTRDKKLKWRSVDLDSLPPRNWEAIFSAGSLGTFESDDGHLVTMIFPGDLLAQGRENPKALEVLRVPFREFAVASDMIFGSIWESRGQVAIVARARTEPYSALPPLRFETFTLLAEERNGELAQSYERSTPFAGRLDKGDHRFRDWAPIYLSDSLVNTEFGAILNITDQMLKSWSQAGKVEYLYFNYPVPGNFPFGKKSLSQIVHEKFEADEVFFNWNTAGAANIIISGSNRILTAAATGSLPITYGADGIPKSAGGADMFEFEEKGYEYFSAMGEPNLTRVVQYTTLYQTFQAVANEDNEMKNSSASRSGQSFRSQSDKVLVEALAPLLEQIELDELDLPAELADPLQKRLVLLKRIMPGLSSTELADLLVNRAWPQMVESDLVAKRIELLAEGEALKKDIENFNSEVSAQIVADINRRGRALEREAQILQLRQAAYLQLQENVKGKKDGFREFTGQLHAATYNSQKSDSVRLGYMVAKDNGIPSAIRTPTIVVSWNTGPFGLDAMGGHNLRAKVIKLVESTSVDGILVEEAGQQGAVVVKYNPKLASFVESNAAHLARKIEHKNVRDSGQLSKVAMIPVSARSRASALRFPGEPRHQALFGRLGKRQYFEKNRLVEDLRKLAQKNDCCVFVARDSKQIAYVAEPSPTPPPAIRVIEIRDTPSLTQHMARYAENPSKSRRSAVLLDMPGENVASLVLNIDAHISRDRIIGLDLMGRRSKLETIGKQLSRTGKKLLSKIYDRQPESVWKQVAMKPIAGKELTTMLEALNWSPTRDGQPIALKLSFAETSAPSQMDLIAGFAESLAGKMRLDSASKKALGVASLDGATPAQFLMTLHNELKDLPAVELKRLAMVVRDGEGEVFLARLNIDNQNVVVGP
jgi:hypothetical protein